MVGIELLNLTKKSAQLIVESLHQEATEIRKLSFNFSDCSLICISKLNKLEALHFTCDCPLPIRVIEEIANSFDNLTELKVPNIPTGFIPLILRNHSRIKGKIQKQFIWVLLQSF